MALVISMLLLCTFCSNCNSDSEPVSSYGKTFIFSVPRIPESGVYIVLLTINIAPLKVSLYSTMSSAKSLITEFTISITKAATYTIDNGLLPDTEAGSHGCFILESDFLFTLFVHIAESTDHLASFMALPEQAWGRRYFVVTLSTRPYVVIVASVATNVKLRLRMDPPNAVKLVLDGDLYTDRRTLMFHLDRYQAYTLSRCNEKFKHQLLSWTGSVVESLEPVGVISGSCTSFMKISSRYVKHYMPSEEEICHSYSNPIRKDLAAEMLVPQYMFGSRYESFRITERTSHEMYILIATDARANIYVPLFQQSIEEYKLRHSGDVRVVPTNFSHFDRAARSITSGGLILAALVLTSSCTTVTETGGPSVVSLIPPSLFNTLYVWHVPPFKNVKNFVVLISKKFDSVQINHVSVRFTTEEILNSANPTYAQKHVELGTQRIDVDKVIVISSDSQFGCFFYGLGHGAYVTLGGLFYRKARQLECINTIAKPNDKVDNDCDGKSDEEKLDNKDDDKDGLVDEDFASATSESVNVFRWGPRGLLNCSGCATTCTAIDGLCEECRDGYKTIYTGCNRLVCPPYKFGLDCEGDCLEKCGMNCENHVTGECPVREEFEFPWYMAYIGLGAVGTIILSLLIFLIVKNCAATVAKKLEKKTEVALDNAELAYYIDSRSQARGSEGGRTDTTYSTDKSSTLSTSSSSSKSQEGGDPISREFPNTTEARIFG